MAKSAHAFRTISEAADEIGVAQHVLRFWETKFAFIRPMKRAGGRRFYRPADIAVLAAVRRLLHHEGYTIKNVQQVHRDHGLKGLTLTAGAASPTIKSFRVPSAGSRAPGFPTAAHPEGLVRALGALKSAKVRLDALLDDR